MIGLSERLLAVAALVRGGGPLADIGTDHAYLPIYLVQNGIIPRAIASDIGEGPLANAEKAVELCGLGDRIELRLSDGLKSYRPEEVNEIVICGMGGNLIEEILLAAPWVRRRETHLVLQPMTHAEDVRRYLCENGFQINTEVCVAEKGRVYIALDAVWMDLANTKTEGYYYFGSLPGRDGPAARYVRSQLQWVHTRLEALRAAERFPEEQAMLRRVLRDYYGENNESI